MKTAKEFLEFNHIDKKATIKVAPIDGDECYMRLSDLLNSFTPQPQPVSVSEEVWKVCEDGETLIPGDRYLIRASEAILITANGNVRSWDEKNSKRVILKLSTHQPTKIDEDCTCINCDEKKETHNICSDCLHEIINENKLPTKIDEGEIMQLFIDSEEDFYRPEVERIIKAIAKLINGGNE